MPYHNINDDAFICACYLKYWRQSWHYQPACTMTFSCCGSELKEGGRQNATSSPRRKYIPSYASGDVEDIINLLQAIQHIQLISNKQRIIMDRDTPQNTAEPTAVSFDGQMLFINEPASGQISIVFDEPMASLHHELKGYILSKITYKTVLAALKKTHPEIIRAQMQKNENGKSQLIVTVQYEFLPEVKEVFEFESRAIEKDQSERAVVQNIRNYIKGMREQLSSLGNIQVISGNLESEGETEVFISLANKRTVFTLSLTLTTVLNDLLKVQMLYYNSFSKERRSSSAVPEEGLYVYNSGKAYTEVKFLAEYEDFEMVVFKIGKAQGTYIITAEKVEPF